MIFTKIKLVLLGSVVTVVASAICGYALKSREEKNNSPAHLEWVKGKGLGGGGDGNVSEIKVSPM